MIPSSANRPHYRAFVAVLTVSTTLKLPDDYVTQPAAILAMRGAGKSNTAVAIAEEMYDAGLPFVVIDPKGDWWGIRSSVDGKGPGLPIPVFGGHHGDVPLEPGSGAFLAETIVELNLTCVLDVSDFASKAQQVQFLTDFATRLFRLHGRSPQARHLFLEEADEYLPQRVFDKMAACVGAWTRIVKQGRSRGLGITIVSQRSAVVNKDALTQVETLIAMRVTSPQDRKAIKGWVEYMALSDELVDSLPTLADGEAWVISPHWLAQTVKVKFRQRRTFDSGATPKHGKIRVPGTIADIDIMKLRELMKATIEKAEAEDPKILAAKVRQLTRERDTLEGLLRAEEEHSRAAAERWAAESQVEVKVPFVPSEIVTLFPRLDGWLAELRATVDAMEQRIKAGEAAIPEPETSPPALRTTPRPARVVEPVPQPARPAVNLLAGDTLSHLPTPGEDKIGSSDRKALLVLTQYGPLPPRRLAALMGMSTRKSTIRNVCSRLRQAGLATGSETIVPTAAGLELVAGDVETLPSGAELIAYWTAKLRGDAGVLEAIINAHPQELTVEELCARTGYDPSKSTIRNVLSRLRSHGLVGSGRTLDPDFAAAIQ